jgi:hypothetical protein
MQSAMDKVRFAKAIRDTGLVSESGLLTSGEVDAIYARVRPHAKVRTFWQRVVSIEDARSRLVALLLQSAASGAITFLAAQSAINFIEFIQCLRHTATKLRSSLNEVMERIVLVNAPLSTA